jgi:hypothetical protein
MSQVVTGARGKVKINGVLVGFISGIDVDVENTLADVDVLGQLERADLAEVGHKCNFTINTFKAVPPQATVGAPTPAGAGAVFPNTAAAIGIDTSAGFGATGVIPGNVDAMRSQAYFDVEIVDDLNKDAVIFYMQNCKLEGGTGRLEARGIWQGTWRFQAQRGFGL